MKKKSVVRKAVSPKKPSAISAAVNAKPTKITSKATYNIGTAVNS